MSFIEKEKLIKADIVSIENRVRHAFNQGYDLGFKDGKKAKPQDIDYKAQYKRLSQKAEIVISQLRADRDRLMSLSSVTPQEPRIGHWTEEFNDLEGEVRFTCSSCGKYQLFVTDFCYHCGSDNREAER